MGEPARKNGSLRVLVATAILGVVARLGRVAESTAWVTWVATGLAIALVVAFAVVQLANGRTKPPA